MRTRPNLRRSRCTSSALALATVLAVGATPAAAQSLQGTGSIVTNTGGAANISTGVNTTTVTLNPGQTVIDWTPFDNAVGNFGGIGFQYDGSTATFQSTGNFAVLNRINVADVTRVVSMDGDINGLVGGQTGGSIYFYSPSGFVLGSNATINVGSLVLSASPITVDGNGLFITGANNDVIFGQAVNPSASITTVGAFGASPGATINASDYVAFVAPRVVHSGTINVDGSAALVGAEAATISFATDNLFTITTQVGTTDANGVVVDGGTITGSASTGIGDYRRVYAVAVPKNDALTMVISNGAQLGFDVAGAAEVFGNTVVLTAGKDVYPFYTAPSAAAGAAGNISITNSSFTSALTADSSGTFALRAVNGNVSAAADVNVTSVGNIDVAAIGDASLDVVGDLNLSTDVYGQSEGQNVTAAQILVRAAGGGSLHVGGDVNVSADAQGGSGNLPGSTSGTGTGGNIYVQASDSGSIQIDGSLDASAVGRGGWVNDAGVNGGNGVGGFIGVLTIGDVSLTNLAAPSGTMTIGGNATLDVSGYGADGIGVECFNCDGASGNGTGGTTWFSAQAGVGSALTLNGSLTMTGIGWGGDSGTQVGGTGTGGDLQLFYGNGATTTILGGVTIDASGAGGDSFQGDGGAGVGGTIFVWRSNAALTSGSLSVGDFMYAFADGHGGDSFGTGTGGTGTGGFSGAYTNVGSMYFGSDVIFTASGFGGYSEGGNGGDGFGGPSGPGGAQLLAGGTATITVAGDTYLGANGRGGDSGSSNGANRTGNGTGGYAVYGTFNGGTLSTGYTNVEAFGIGGQAFNGPLTGGFGQGGYAEILAQGGSVTTGDLFINTNGFGGFVADAGGTNGNGTGGTVDFYAIAGGSFTAANIYAYADGIAGNGNECFVCGGNSGVGQGGDITVRADGSGSAITVPGAINLSAIGTGAYSGALSAGDGFGGSIRLAAENAGSVQGGSAQLNATGYGSTDENGVGGGDGTGGIAGIESTAGSMTLGNVDVRADGVGANSTTGSGGDAVGGTAYIAVQDGTATISGATTVSATGFGGTGTLGGSGSGGGSSANLDGYARISASGTGQLNLNGSATINARGVGGVGTTAGGAGEGGQAGILASGGGDILIAGRSIVSSDGTGQLGAVGRGGQSTVSATGGGAIDLFELNLRADGRGGNGNATTDAGDGFGGTAVLSADGAGSSVSVTQQIQTGTLQDREMLSADGFGGDTFGGGDARGGLGTGGTLNLTATNGGNVSLASGSTVDILVRVRGYGGQAAADGTTGGDAVGGNINVVVDNATMTTGRLQLSSYAQGGNSLDAGFNANGGNGTGGSRLITVTNGGTLTTWIPGGVAGGSGGEGTGTGVGGNGSGGVARLTVLNSTLNLTGTTIIVAQNTGGNAAGTGAQGSTTGGQVATADIQNSTVTIASGATLLVGANGFGGPAGGFFAPGTGAGGNAVGGTAQTNIFNSTVTGGTISTSANAQAGPGTTAGGNATGGTANVNLIGSTINGEALFVSAVATGGSAVTGNAGDAVAGTARLNAIGGTSTLTLANGMLLSAMGDGGAITGASGQGGDGTGGTVNLLATGGNLTINGGVNLQTRGMGGSGGTGGTGGNGLGGFTNLAVYGFNLTLNGDLQILANGVGGAGAIGGNGAAQRTDVDEYQPTAAQILSGNGGTINVTGTTFIDVTAVGGAASIGNGGSALAGEVDISGEIGSTTLANVNVNANATGGAGGSAGGAGGNAVGGNIDVVRGLSSATINGPLNFGAVTATADALGGAGGSGSNGTTGGTGGAGGNATGGEILFASNAAGSSLNAGNVSLSATATGGLGGNGGTGSAGNGGNGGSGGSATGGTALSGSISNDLANGPGATMTIGNLAITTSAFAGNGGNGGTGTTVNGAGGAGGDAFGGGSFFGIRGIVGTVGDITLLANATGGNGGGGSTVGDGGDATNGILTVESKDRFNHPDQRGTLTAGNITGRAIATAGTGGTNGTTIGLGGSYFRVLNGDATIASVDLEIDSGAPAATADFVSAIDGNAIITGNFRFVTTNNLSLFADNGSLSATTITLAAANFVPDAASEPPLAAGTFFADTFDIVTGNNFTTSANLDSVNLLEIIAPGSITANDITSQDAVYLNAQSGSIAVNDINADLEIRLTASTGIAANDLTSGSYVYANTGGQLAVNDVSGASGIDVIGLGGVTFANLTSGTYANLFSNGAINGGTITTGTSIYGESGGDMDLGVLDAGDWVELLAFGDMTITSIVAGEYIDIATYLDGEGGIIVGGSIQTGNLTAGNSIDVHAGTSATLGNLSAGIVNPSTDPFAEYTIGVLANDFIVTGDIDTITHAGLASPGTITAGNVNVGGIFMVLGTGNISVGSIDAGTNVYMADFSMMALGGSLTDGFDPAPILASAPVPTGGSITIGGPVTTGDFQAAAGTTLTAQAITADGVILASSGGNALLGNLTAGGAIDVQSSGNLTTGNVDSGSTLWLAADGSATTGSLNAPTSIDMRVGGNILIGGAATTDGYIDIESFAGNISALDMTAGDSIELAADNGGVTAGNLSAGLVNPAPAGEYHVAVWAGGGNILIGDAAAAGDILLAASGNLTTGDLSPGARLLALAGGNMQLGSITSGGGQILIGDYSMFALGGTPGDGYDVDLVFAAAPVRTTGSITLGNVSAASFSLAAGGNLTIGNIDASNSIVLDAGGNMVTGDIQSLFGDIDLAANGSITAGDLTAGAGILIDGGGAVSLGNIAAGVTPILFGFGTQDIGVGNPVEIFGASIATGNISTDGYVGLYTPGAVSTGSITAFHDIVALAGGNANFGAITTDESFLLAGYGNFASLFTPGGQFDPSLIFSLFNYSSTGGNAVYGGPVSASVIGSYAGGNTTVGAMTAGSYADIDTGGTLFLTGAITSPGFVGLTSSDIDIGANASVAAGSIGFLSISSVGTFIGDNTGGNGGYRLSQAEINRTSAGAYEFEVQTDRGAAATMIVGDLTLDMTGSQYNDVAEFWIGNDQTEVPNGIIRVVGDTLFRVNIDQEVAFEAGTIEVDAATGSISLVDGQNNLSGYLGLYAPNIFVASADILAKLEVDPRYAGYVDELNAPAAVQRPDGVIRAASLEIDSFYAPLANILVQNTGSADVPAGFLITDADIGDGETTPEPGSINLVINGQIVTEGGTLTGIDVRDLLVSAFGTEAFAPESTINGCALTGDCRAPVEELPPAVVVTPPIIEILTGDPLGEPGFGNEPDIDDNVDGDATESGSPINAPQPLFDTRPLVDSSLVDDPISGAGNPSLYGASDEDDDDDDEDDGKDKKDVRKGDGK